jgi:hypothetical protein
LINNFKPNSFPTHQKGTHWERNQENNPIHNNLKNIKYLGINLSKEVKDLYTESYKTMKKEIEEDIRR